MKARTILAASLALLAVAGLAALPLLRGSGGPGAAKVRLAPDDAALVALGEDVYAAHCAACHGANLEGEPNWRRRGPDGMLPAPPHDETGHTWHHPDAVLFELTKHGLPDEIGGRPYPSAMPAYEGVLTDREIVAVLSYIKSRWPEDVAARHDRINAEAAR
jgi:mono/diheme cytochrome c family protein